MRGLPGSSGLNLHERKKKRRKGRRQEGGEGGGKEEKYILNLAAEERKLKSYATRMGIGVCERRERIKAIIIRLHYF